MLARPAALAGIAVRSTARAASTVPLEEPLQGLPGLRPASARAAPKTESTTLANGLRVVTQEDFGQAASLGLFVDAGSRYENDSNSGVTHFCEHLAFKSTEQRSSLRIVRDVEMFGGNVGATAAREYLAYNVDVLRPYLKDAVDTLGECVSTPKLAKWDVDEARQVVAWELESFEVDPSLVVAEVVHAAAYGDASPLGRPLWCPRRNLDAITSDVIGEFQQKHFTAERMVLAAAGVEHGRLVELADAALGGMARGDGSAATTPASVYRGGERRIRGESPLTHVTLALNAEGGWNSQSLLPFCVLHMLLGGGSAFSPGGPGKGMYSKLYAEVLNKHHWADSCTAWNAMFNASGLLGIYGTSTPERAGDLTRVMAEQLMSVASTKADPQALERAKNQLKSSVLMNLESRQILQEDIGRQVLSFGAREDPAALVKKIQAVSADDVRDAASALVASPVSLAAYGDVSHVPAYDDVSNMFK